MKRRNGADNKPPLPLPVAAAYIAALSARARGYNPRKLKMPGSSTSPSPRSLSHFSKKECLRAITRQAGRESHRRAGRSSRLHLQKPHQRDCGITLWSLGAGRCFLSLSASSECRTDALERARSRSLGRSVKPACFLPLFKSFSSLLALASVCVCVCVSFLRYICHGHRGSRII